MLQLSELCGYPCKGLLPRGESLSPPLGASGMDVISLWVHVERPPSKHPYPLLSLLLSLPPQGEGDCCKWQSREGLTAGATLSLSLVTLNTHFLPVPTSFKWYSVWLPYWGMMCPQAHVAEKPQLQSSLLPHSVYLTFMGLYTCGHMHVCACSCAFGCMCVHVCRGQRTISSVIPQDSMIFVYLLNYFNLIFCILDNFTL